MRQALWPLGWDLRKHKYCIPDPDKPGYLKYDPTYKEYEKLLEEETKKRLQVMTEIMKSRGIDYVYSADAIEKEIKEHKKAFDDFLTK